MKKIYWLAGGIAAAGAVAVLIASVYTRREQEQQSHYRNEETEVIMSNIANATVKLYAAGNSLDEARQLNMADSRFWLRRGNYFLHVEQAGRASYYPVSVLGYSSGPDENGFLGVTVRPFPNEDPPRLLPLQEFAFVPSGYFLLGDRLNPQDPHYAWLGAYFVEKFEVTNAEFREFWNDPQGYADDSNWTEEGRAWKRSASSAASSLLKPGDAEYERFGRDDQPVTDVKWYEANAFCRWLTHKLGNGIWEFSLPSEAEWEKAARGPDGFDYGLGNTLSDAQVRLYNWKKNPDAPTTVLSLAGTKTAYSPNRYGIYHMSGNVSEWTQSIDRPYNREHPYVEEEWNRSDSSVQRVVRGGSWYSASIALLNLAYRDVFQPVQSSNERGFRIVARRIPITTKQ